MSPAENQAEELARKCAAAYWNNSAHRDDMVNHLLKHIPLVQLLSENAELRERVCVLNSQIENTDVNWNQQKLIADRLREENKGLKMFAEEIGAELHAEKCNCEQCLRAIRAYAALGRPRPVRHHVWGISEGP